MKKMFKVCTLVSVFAAAGVSSASNAESPSTEIRVNASYSANSLWTEQEIRSRFAVTRDAFKQACPGISIVLNELIRIEDPDLQDVDGSLSPASVQAMKTLLGRFRSDVRPTIFYVRQAKRPSSDFTDLLGQAYTLGGPRPLKQFHEFEWNDPVIKAQSALGWDYAGILDWNKLQDHRSIHGVSIVTQGNSLKAPPIPVLGGYADPIGVDRHELGHVLLNDGSHRNTPRNFMGNGERTSLDRDQCELIRSYHLMEAERDRAIQSGIRQICELYHVRDIPGKPSFCR